MQGDPVVDAHQKAMADIDTNMDAAVMSWAREHARFVSLVHLLNLIETAQRVARAHGHELFNLGRNADAIKASRQAAEQSDDAAETAAKQ